MVESKLNPVGMEGEIEQLSGVPPTRVGVRVVIAELFTRTTGLALNDRDVGLALSSVIARAIVVVVAPEKLEAVIVYVV